MATSEIAKYSFLPWLRQGLARQIDSTEFPDRLPLPDIVRSKVEALLELEIEGVKLGADNYASIDVNKIITGDDDPRFAGKNILQRIHLVGPGEVTGIQERAIVKEEPRNGITNFEPNFLPYIEFYDEDFPWRYTPATPDAATPGRLRPWLTLIVLEETEFEKLTGGDFLLPAIGLRGDLQSLFPKKDQTWAWAHVHVNQQLLDDLEPDHDDLSFADQVAEDLDRGNAAAVALYDLVKQNPNGASSRILCPRKLKPNTAYHAFLVPAFEQGRMAGLGRTAEEIASIDVQKCAWDPNGVRLLGNTFPYYHTWYFRTGEQLDFEYLVRIIEPRDLVKIAPEIGRRPIDLQDSGYLLDYEGGTADNGGFVELEGALQLPSATRDDFLDTADAKKAEYITQLQHIINLSDDWKEDPFPTSYAQLKEQIFTEENEQVLDDPIVTAPLYGQWHLGVERTNFDVLDTANFNQKENWFHQLNLDPRNRVAAGFGTNTIKQDQDNLVDRAWDQVGRVMEAIRQLRQGQFSLKASEKLYEKNLVLPADPIRLIGFTANIHDRLLQQTAVEDEDASIERDNVTVRQHLDNFSMPRAILTRDFTKFARPNGPLLKRSFFGRSTAFQGSSDESESSPAVESSVAGDLIFLRSQVFARPTLFSHGILYSQENLSNLMETFVAAEAITDTSGDGFNGSAWPGGITKRIIAEIIGFDDEDADANNSGLTTSDNTGNLTFALDNLNAVHFVLPPQQSEAVSTLGNEELKRVCDDICEKLNPRQTVRNRVLAGVDLRLKQSQSEEIIPRSLNSHRVDGVVKTEKLVEPIAYPEFSDSTYLSLREISPDLLLPGLNKIPQNTFSFVETNRVFIESYMVGLNHEMARELLWREFPTDQRGSYFRKFWESIDNPHVSEDELDIKPIHLWGTAGNPSSLGRNHPKGEEQFERLVFVVRGELLKKFPNTLIYLQGAKEDENGNRTLDRNSDPIFPVFQAKADPDITFLGFNMSAEQVLGQESKTLADGSPDPKDNGLGCYIVVRERPGEPRFGLDLPAGDEHDSFLTDVGEWNDLDWSHLAVSDGQYIDLNALCCQPGGDPLAGLNVSSPKDVHNNEGLKKPVEAMDEPHEAGRTEEKMVWAKNSAHMAGVFLQLPFMVAIHASEMISL